MGGRGSGGARVGAGRKSKDAQRRWLSGQAPSPPPPSEPAEILAPPATLAPAERAIWLALAPQAVAAGTLTPTTAEDFRVLTALTVEAELLLAARRAEGWTDHGLKLAAAYRGVVQRLEVKMRGFQLAPIGKPIRPMSSPEPDPFAEFDDPPPMGGGDATPS